MSWNVTWTGPAAELAEALDAEVTKLAFTRSAAEVADAQAVVRAVDRAVYNGVAKPWPWDEPVGLPPFFEGKVAKVSAYGHRNADGTGSFSLNFALELAPKAVETAGDIGLPVMPS